MSEADGLQWLYICSKCGYQTTAGTDFQGECPQGHNSWLCHLLNDGSKPKISGDKASDPIITPPDNLSQVISDSTLPKNKPGPKRLPLEDLVSQLASQGLSSRAIATKLNEQGISVSYKTIQRRLQKALL